MTFIVKSELVSNVKRSDDIIYKKEETHRIKDANRIFAHFR